MAIEETPKAKMLLSKTRHLWIAAVLFIVILCISGVLTIPFIFESPSIRYKFGFDKTLIRAGQMVGLVAATLLLLQLPLAARLKWLDRIFSLPTLYRLHRINALTLVLLALLHPVLVFAPDGIFMIPFEARYWPEWVGAGLLIMICCQVVISNWRRVFLRTYEKWLSCHRMAGMVIFSLLIIHVLYVSETFEDNGLPRFLVFAAAGCLVILWLWIRMRWMWLRKKPFIVTRIETAGKDAYAVDLKPATQKRFYYFPGQFAFVSFESAHISREVHPFTISSSPTRPSGCQFTIRCSGDWTNNIGNIEQGDRAYIHGPFGRFSHLVAAPDREVIMIAGGIGITPMLSMLRYMADGGDQRCVTLIWSNRSGKHLCDRDELVAMEQELTCFRWVPIFTRETGKGVQFGRLDRTKLERLLKNRSRDASVFLCGPRPMIKQLRRDLKQIGFPARSINTEEFGL